MSTMAEMAENYPNRAMHVENKLARELMEARSKLRERSLIEGQKPYYKVRQAYSHRYHWQRHISWNQSQFSLLFSR